MHRQLSAVLLCQLRIMPNHLFIVKLPAIDAAHINPRLLLWLDLVKIQPAVAGKNRDTKGFIVGAGFALCVFQRRCSVLLYLRGRTTQIAQSNQFDGKSGKRLFHGIQLCPIGCSV